MSFSLKRSHNIQKKVLPFFPLRHTSNPDAFYCFIRDLSVDVYKLYFVLFCHQTTDVFLN